MVGCASKGKVKERDHTYLAIQYLVLGTVSPWLFNIGALVIKQGLFAAASDEALFPGIVFLQFRFTGRARLVRKHCRILPF